MFQLLEDIQTVASQMAPGTLLETATGFMVVVPGRVVKCCSLFEAVDRAMKVFYCLQLEYPESTSDIFVYLQRQIYKLRDSCYNGPVDKFTAAVATYKD